MSPRATDEKSDVFTTTANTALVESLTVNTDEIKRYARVVITVAGGTGAGAVSVVGLGRKKYN